MKGLELRKDFPALQQKVNGKPLIYLDSAASTLKPQNVIKRVEKLYAMETANVHRGAHFLSDQATENYEQARKTISSFINASSSNEIIFTRGTTESVNLVAHSLVAAKMTEGDEIILTQMEHHSNIVPWQQAAKKVGAKIKFIPITEEGDLNLDEYKKFLTDKTKLVSLVHCSNALGTINPVKEIIQEAHSVGAKVFIDGAQSVSAFSVDVQDLNCDFFAFSGHKLFAPFGIGVLFGKEEILNSLEPYQSGGSMISEVNFEGSTFLASPHRFEAGTPNVAGAIGLAEAINYLQEIGMDNIENYEKNFLSYAKEELKAIEGFHLIGSPKEATNVISFTMEGIHHSDISSIMNQQGVAIRSGHHCCQPLMSVLGVPGTSRLSFSIYSTEEDLEAAKQAVIKVKEFF